MNNLLKFSILVFSILLSGTGFAQELNKEPFTWSASAEPAKIQAGNQTTLRLAIQIAPDHFIYRDMTSFTLLPLEGFQAGEPVFPEGEKTADPFDPEGKEKEIYRNRAEFVIPLQIASTVSPGTYEVEVTAGYQGCSSSVCFFPKRLSLTTVLTVEAGAAPADFEPLPLAGTEPASDASDRSEGGRFASALQKGIFWAFLFVFGGGILTSFTPCVYPLIPITISLFGAREASSRGKAFLLSATYVLGIATMYSALGVLAAATGAVFGQVMTNPWVVSAVALVFVVFGASMLGAFEIQLPAGIQNRISRAGGKGFLGAFTMGLFGGIIAAPCTGPALGAVLAYVATTQNLWLGFWLLFTFAWGLGLLFLVLGTFSGLASRLPKSGAWMNGVKSFFAIVLFAFALYFLKDAFPILKSILKHSPVYFIASGIMMVIGLALGAVQQSFSNPSKRIRIFKAAGVLLMTLGLFIGIGSATSTGGDLPQPAWVYSDSEGFRLARETGKPLMIDFYADWCAACKELDHKTYSDPRVLERLKDFVSVKLDFTESTPETREWTEKYEIVGLPTIIFYDAEGNLLPAKRLIGFKGPKEFLEHLDGIQP
jgi:thiol:disulfide interchange protein DsbD